MEVDLGKRLRFENPILTASGTFHYGKEFAPYMDLKKLGGVIVKSLSAKPWPGHPPPRGAETPSGMLNAIGLQNPGVAAFCDRELPVARPAQGSRSSRRSSDTASTSTSVSPTVCATRRASSRSR